MSKQIVIVVVGFAAGDPCPIAGQYLEYFDFEADDGKGFGIFTNDIAKAQRFNDLAEAAAFWKTVSQVRPTRPDGRPNRPFTATTITFENAPRLKG